MTKLEFAETVATLCKRPAAYTNHGTLPEVIAHLDGLAKGLDLQPGSHWGISGFFEWLKKKLGRAHSIRDDELLLTFGDQDAAFRAFARLYREYAELEAAAEAEKISQPPHS